MREYFRNARVIFSEARRALDSNEKSESSLAAQFRDWRSRLSNNEFTVSNGRSLSAIARAVDQRSGHRPAPARIHRASRRPLAAETERRLEHAASAFAAWCASPPQPLWPPLRNILSLPHSAAALRAMHDTNLLQAMFPEWKTISCLVVPDFYHRYTVDEHTLVAIEKLAELGRPGIIRTPRGAASPKSTRRSRPRIAALCLALSRLRQRRSERRPRASLGPARAHRRPAHSNARAGTERG
jgi:[protein-PII] uridylyltransferase